jgi:hypothetical protein
MRWFFLAKTVYKTNGRAVIREMGFSKEICASVLAEYWFYLTQKGQFSMKSQ